MCECVGGVCRCEMDECVLYVYGMWQVDGRYVVYVLLGGSVVCGMCAYMMCSVFVWCIQGHAKVDL